MDGRPGTILANTMTTTADASEVELCRRHFDAACYSAELARIGGTVDQDVDLCAHFCDIGWRAGLDPCRWFSVSHYISTYVDIEQANVNPFHHYLIAGEREGRSANHHHDERARKIGVLRSLSSLADEANGWEKDLSRYAILDRDGLDAAVADIAGPGVFAAVLAVSHDNYSENAGGIQVSIKREMSLYRQGGGHYFHVFPAKPMPMLNVDTDGMAVVSIDGQLLGIAELDDLAALIARKSRLEAVVIHSLLGFNPALMAATIAKLNPPSTLYWAHDFSPFCPSWTLMRNKLAHCDAPPIASAMCRHCYYGEARMNHLAAFREFFARLDVAVICPSDNTRAIYERLASRHGYAMTSIQTLKHLAITNYKNSFRPANRRLRIAFIGHPHPYKGWHEFLSLFYARELSGRCEFYHFCADDSPIGHGLTYVPVNTTIDGPDAMVAAIRANKIDFSFIWPHWPETFCLAAMEAAMGESRIITNTSSGNVFDFVDDSGLGHAFADLETAVAWLCDLSDHPGRLRALTFPSDVAVSRSGGSNDLIARPPVEARP